MYTSKFTNTITTEVEVEVAHKYKVGDVIRRVGYSHSDGLDRRILEVKLNSDGQAVYRNEHVHTGEEQAPYPVDFLDDPKEWKLVPPKPFVTYNITIEQYGGVGTYCSGIKNALDKYLQSNILDDDESYHVVINNDKNPRFNKCYPLRRIKGLR